MPEPTDNPEIAGDGDAAVVPDGDAAAEAPRSKVPWKKVAALAGGAAVTVAGTVVATLVATHKSARRENFAAYMNGMKDGMCAVENDYHYDPSDHGDAYYDPLDPVFDTPDG